MQQLVLEVDYKYKIGILVALQISLIMISFTIIAYLESQTLQTGTLINVAGKNRHLASQTHISVNHVLIDNESNTISVENTLRDLENNILFLKHGGEIDGVILKPLPSQFDDDWDDIWSAFTAYKITVLKLIDDKEMLRKEMEMLDHDSIMLVNLSDMITLNISNESRKFSNDLLRLEMILGVINVITHIFMIIIIWRLFNKYSDEKTVRERFATLGEFATIIAHDIRNPLGTIRNSTLLIQNSTNREHIDNEIKRIDRAITRISHQVNDVLNYVRDVPLIQKPASIKNIINRSIDSMRIPSSIKISIPENDIIIPCDEQKLEFVFSNIILNAIQAIKGQDYNGDGDADDNKNNSKSPEYISIKINDIQDTQIQISFENSGPSIPKSDIHKIFEPLYTTKMKGTGLGLTGCRNIVNRHNGSIKANNRPVTFTIQLPKHQV